MKAEIFTIERVFGLSGSWFPVRVLLCLVATVHWACDEPPGGTPSAKVAELDWSVVSTLVDPADDTLAHQLVATFLGERVAVFSYSGTTIDLYDLQGRHLRRLGREGEGPGEFRFLGGLWASGDRLWVFDPLLRRTTRFELGDGAASVLASQLAMSSPPYRFVGGLPDGSLVLALLKLSRSEALGPVSDSLLLTLFDTAGAEVRRLDQATGLLRYRSGDGTLLNMPFSPMLMAVVRDSTVYVGDGSESRIVVKDLRTGTTEELRWSGAPELRVDEEHVQTVRDQLPSGSRLLEEGELLDAMEGMLMPAYAEFAVDDQGRLWLGQYEWRYDNLWAPISPEEGARRTWVVVSPTGRVVGRLSLPVATTIEDIQRDQLLMLRKDQYGLESLALVEVELPPRLRDGS